MADTKHTPLPWRREDGDGFDILAYEYAVPVCSVMTADDFPCIDNDADYQKAQTECDANAAYIVKACNAYPKLVEALKSVRYELLPEQDSYSAKATCGFCHEWAIGAGSIPHSDGCPLAIIRDALRESGEEL